MSYVIYYIYIHLCVYMYRSLSFSLISCVQARTHTDTERFGRTAGLDIYTSVDVYIHTHTHTCTHTRARAHTRTHIHTPCITHTHTHTRARARARARAHTHTHTHTHTLTHSHTHTPYVSIPCRVEQLCSAPPSAPPSVLQNRVAIGYI